MTFLFLFPVILAVSLPRAFTASYAAYSLPASLIPQALREVQALDQERYSARELLDILAPLLQKTCREQDREMMREIARDFLNERVKKRVNFKEVEETLRGKDLEVFIADWKRRMYLKLLDLYKIEYDQPFLTEMLNDPDFYGLTFDAYQMMTFEVDTGAKREERMRVEEDAAKGPSFEEFEEVLAREEL